MGKLNNAYDATKKFGHKHRGPLAAALGASLLLGELARRRRKALRDNMMSSKDKLIELTTKKLKRPPPRIGFGKGNDGRIGLKKPGLGLKKPGVGFGPGNDGRVGSRPGNGRIGLNKPGVGFRKGNNGRVGFKDGSPGIPIDYNKGAIGDTQKNKDDYARKQKEAYERAAAYLRRKKSGGGRTDAFGRPIPNPGGGGPGGGDPKKPKKPKKPYPTDPKHIYKPGLIQDGKVSAPGDYHIYKPKKGSKGPKGPSGPGGPPGKAKKITPPTEDQWKNYLIEKHKKDRNRTIKGLPTGSFGTHHNTMTSISTSGGGY